MSVFIALIIWSIVSLPIGIIVGRLIESPDDDETNDEMRHL